MIDLDFFSSSSVDVAMANNFGQNWPNDLHSASWHSETGRNMAILIKKNIKYCSYIVCKYDQDQSSSCRDCEGNNCTFLDETAKIDIQPNISTSTGENFTSFSALVDRYV